MFSKLIIVADTTDRSLQDASFLMSDLGLLVSSPTDLFGKRLPFNEFNLSFNFFLLLRFQIWVLKLSFPSPFVVPFSKSPQSSISQCLANGEILREQSRLILSSFIFCL